VADIAPGTFFPVVGPSGAGKDTLLDEVRRYLTADPRFVFARRTITRPSDAGGEAHRAVSEMEFEAEEAAGRFALRWRAHGLAYGIPVEVEDALAAGRHVIANLSRAIVADAAARYASICVLHITAPTEVLRARLASRQREDSNVQAARVARAADIPTDVAVVEVINDGTIEAGARKLLDALHAAVANGAR
jgi:phosphonate metabolism protein PhnN/1,5-bisphosphokinase (PRPP-forming)